LYITLEPSWSYGILSYYSKKTLVTFDKNIIDKTYIFDFMKNQSLETIKNTLEKEIPLIEREQLNDNLKLVFIKQKIEKPDSFEINSEILHKDFPVKGFNDFFSDSKSDLESAIGNKENNIKLYYHVYGNIYNISNSCIIN